MRLRPEEWASGLIGKFVTDFSSGGGRELGLIYINILLNLNTPYALLQNYCFNGNNNKTFVENDPSSIYKLLLYAIKPFIGVVIYVCVCL